jgi:hypothetical protein
MPLYFVAMPKSIITIIELSFVSASIHIVDGVRSKTQTPRVTKFVSLQEDILREVSKDFINWPLNPRGGSSNPLRPPRPPRYYGLPMVNPYMPPLPLNRPYRRPFKDSKYVKDSNLDAHVKVFKAIIKANSEIDDAKIIHLLSFTLRDIVFDWCNNYMGDYPNCTFIKY